MAAGSRKQHWHPILRRCEVAGCILPYGRRRLNVPVLICPLLVATAMSAIVASSVSPGAMRGPGGISVTVGHFDGIQSSVREPIWFTFD